jgi:hypothetical protein
MWLASPNSLTQELIDYLPVIFESSVPGNMYLDMFHNIMTGVQFAAGPRLYWFWCPSILLFSGYWGLLLCVCAHMRVGKQPGLRADHLPLSRTNM